MMPQKKKIIIEDKFKEIYDLDENAERITFKKVDFMRLDLALREFSNIIGFF